jgi:hypothetical protein
MLVRGTTQKRRTYDSRLRVWTGGLIYFTRFGDSNKLSKIVLVHYLHVERLVQYLFSKIILKSDVNR